MGFEWVVLSVVGGRWGERGSSWTWCGVISGKEVLYRVILDQSWVRNHIIKVQLLIHWNSPRVRNVSDRDALASVLRKQIVLPKSGGPCGVWLATSIALSFGALVCPPLPSKPFATKEWAVLKLGSPTCQRNDLVPEVRNPSMSPRFRVQHGLGMTTTERG